MLGAHTLMTDTLMADMLMTDMLVEGMLGCGGWRWMCRKSLLFTPNVHLYLAFFL